MKIDDNGNVISSDRPPNLELIVFITISILIMLAVYSVLNIYFPQTSITKNCKDFCAPNEWKIYNSSCYCSDDFKLKKVYENE